MDKLELYNEINNQLRRKSQPPISQEEFIVAISSLEVKGLIETDANQCFLPSGVEIMVSFCFGA